MVLIVGIVVFNAVRAKSANFTNFWRNASLSATPSVPAGRTEWMIGTLTLIAVAMVGSLFASDAWNNITFTAAEVKNPSRTLPLSLALGTGIVTLLYVLANVAYLRLLPMAGDPAGHTAIARGIQYAAESRVGTAAAEVTFGPAGGIAMAIAILISAFGCSNGLILAGARIYYAMSKDGLFFKSVGRVNKFHAPACRADCAVRLDLHLVPFGNVQPVARFSDFRGVDFLHFDAYGTFYTKAHAAGDAAAVSCVRLPRAACSLSRDGGIYRSAAFEV